MGIRSGRLAALTVALTLIVAGCSLAGGNTFTLQLAGTDPGIDPLFVTVADETGDLHDVGQQVGFPGGQPDASTWNPPGQPNQVLVSWSGGACDESVTMKLTRQGSGYRIAMATKVKTGACTMEAVPRDVLLTFKHPVDAATVTLVSV